MRFKLSSNGWLIAGQWMQEAGKEIDFCDASPDDLIQLGLTPPADSLALDLDAALLQHRVYGHISEKLVRRLSPEDEQVFLARCNLPPPISRPLSKSERLMAHAVMRNMSSMRR